MPRKTSPLLPAASEMLRQFGERLRLARLRRHLSAKQVAERAGMTPMTLRGLERGGSGVTIGAYLAVMQVLGIEQELDRLAQADPVGRSLQDARLIQPIDIRVAENIRVTDEPTASTESGEPPGRRNSSPAPRRSAKKTKAASAVRSRSDKGGFVSSRELAALLKPASKAKRR
jgi:transcriptional regulator with XRE-family HTH domain